MNILLNHIVAHMISLHLLAGSEKRTCTHKPVSPLPPPKSKDSNGGMSSDQTNHVPTGIFLQGSHFIMSVKAKEFNSWLSCIEIYTPIAQFCAMGVQISQ